MLQPKNIGWVIELQNQNQSICCLRQTQFISKEAHKLKMKGQKKTFPANRNEKKTDAAILTSDRL